MSLRWLTNGSLEVCILGLRVGRKGQLLAAHTFYKDQFYELGLAQRRIDTAKWHGEVTARQT